MGSSWIMFFLRFSHFFRCVPNIPGIAIWNLYLLAQKKKNHWFVMSLFLRTHKIFNMSKNHSWFMNHSNSLAVSIMTQKKCGSSCTLVNLVFVQLFRLFLWTRHSTYALFDKRKNPLLQLWPKRESPAKHPDADQCKTLECNISQKKNQFQLSLTLGYCAKCIFNRSLTFGIRQRIWPLNKNGKTPLFCTTWDVFVYISLKYAVRCIRSTDEWIAHV